MFAEFISNEEEEFYMICPKCGSEMPDDSAFCTRCGASLHTGTQENQNSQGVTTAGKSAGDAIRLRKSTGKQRSVLWQSTDEQWDAVRAALCRSKGSFRRI